MRVPVRPFLVSLVVLGACAPGGEAPEAPSDPLLRLGHQVYTTHCITCHQADARGIAGSFPPLRGTEWILGDEGRLIRLLLHGMCGPIEVDGETYDNVMTPHGFLSDEQIAAVLTYVRSHFGNEAGPISPAQVTAVRAASTQEGYWEPSVLEGRTGIP
jgi:mono/diheme cytochrome c family protein